MENEQKHFTVHQLSVFCTVAHHLSYTRAADALYLSQPAVTQQVRTLEEALGARLFARSGRGIVLTVAGQKFLCHAERLLARLAETASVVQEIHELGRGSVLLGASISAGTYVVPSLLGVFHARYPRVHLTLVVDQRRSLEERLIARELDLVVMSMLQSEDRFNVEILRPYELIIVASPTHPLVGRSAIALADLQGDRFLLREAESGTRLETEQYFARRDFSTSLSLELGSIEAIKEGVIAGLGIGVLSREAVALEVARGDLALLDVQGFPLQRYWYLVSLKGRQLSLAASALQKFLLTT